MYLLLGSPFDECCVQVEARLRDRGHTVVVVDDLFSAASAFSWHFAHTPGGSDHNTRLQFKESAGFTEGDIDGVLVRDALWRASEGWSTNDAAYMFTEIQAALLGWLWSLPGRVVNRLPPWLWYRPVSPLAFWRPLLHRAGVLTPDAIMGNDPHRLRRWQERHPAGAVYSPITTSDHFLLSTAAEWDVLTAVARHSPVAVSELHAQTYLVCIVGDRLFWDQEPPALSPQLTRALLRFTVLAGLDSVQLTLADLPEKEVGLTTEHSSGAPRIAVTAVNPGVCFPLFRPAVQQAMADALVGLLLESPAQHAVLPVQTTPIYHSLQGGIPS